jgi:methyl-accepting chemotaxis protein
VIDRHSISFRLNTLFLLVVSVVLLGFGVFNYSRTKQALEDSLNRQVDSVLSRLGGSLPEAVWNFDKKQIQKIEQSEMSAGFIEAITLTTETEGVVGVVRNGNSVISGDRPMRRSDLTRSAELQYEDKGKKTNIGKLEIFVSTAEIKEALAAEVWLLVAQIAIVDIIIFLALSAGLKWIVLTPLRGIGEALNNIAEGEADLTRRLDATRRDEFGEVARGFNQFVGRLQEVIGHVRDSSVQLAQAAEETSRVTEQTNEAMQAEKLEVTRVAQSVNEFSQHSHEITQSAGQASEAAGIAQSEAGRGETVVLDTVASINELSREVDNVSRVIHELASNSDKIAQVLGVIKDIAGQTNLLALNAAIEAARAGEQGRGFAVVADEVRKLANRTHESTLEIEQVIALLRQGVTQAVSVMEQGKASASSGVRHAEVAGTAIGAIKEAISRIGKLNAAIAEAAARQNAMVGSISASVERISASAERTADGSQETAQASESLTRLADQLAAKVERFRV